MSAWQQSYSVGVRALDHQHRKLLDLCVQCEDLLADEGEDAHERYHILLNELTEYVKSHFAYEEMLLRQCGYPKLAGHVEEHEKYWEQLALILAAAAAGTDTRVEVRTLLQQWWLNHILREDMQYRACVAGLE